MQIKMSILEVNSFFNLKLEKNHCTIFVPIASLCMQSFENKRNKILKFPSFIYFKIFVYL